MDMYTLYLIVPLAPLLGAIIAGFFGKLIGRTLSHGAWLLPAEKRRDWCSSAVYWVLREGKVLYNSARTATDVIA